MQGVIGSDITLPIISNVQVVDITDTTARITWTTDELADSCVNIGDICDDTLVISHSITLTGLSSGTTYDFTVSSADARGNKAEEAGSFTTIAMDGVVDNADYNFSVEGTWDSGIGGFRGDYRYHVPGDGSETATWSAELTDGPGYYEVFTWYPENIEGAAANAQFTINHTGVSDTVLIDQGSGGGGDWVSLGTYNFADIGGESKIDYELAEGSIISFAGSTQPNPVTGGFEIDLQNNSGAFDFLVSIEGIGTEKVIGTIDVDVTNISVNQKDIILSLEGTSTITDSYLGIIPGGTYTITADITETYEGILPVVTSLVIDMTLSSDELSTPPIDVHLVVDAKQPVPSIGYGLQEGSIISFADSTQPNPVKGDLEIDLQNNSGAFDFAVSIEGIGAENVTGTIEEISLTDITIDQDSIVISLSGTSTVTDSYLNLIPEDTYQFSAALTTTFADFLVLPGSFVIDMTLSSDQLPNSMVAHLIVELTPAMLENVILSDNADATVLADAIKFEFVEYDTVPPVITNVQVSDITLDSAVITWDTDELSTGEVAYSSTAGDYTASDSVPVISHSITLTGLSPDTTYNFIANSVDVSGNMAVSGEDSFATLPEPDVIPPDITNIQSVVDVTTATIIWDTDEPADSCVNIEGSEICDGGLVISHSILLAGLSSNTTYSILVSSTDASGNNASLGYSFTTLPEPDVTPPDITNVQSVVDVTTATIIWDTDEPADSCVNIESSEICDGGLVISHSITLPDLSPDTTYSITVSSADASGNSASVEYSFTTSQLDGIVDNADYNFSVVGTWGTDNSTPEFFGPDYRYHDAGTGAATAIWDAELTNGPDYYEVFAFYPADENAAANALFTINHAGISETVAVDQSINGGDWVSLGIYYFDGLGSETARSYDVLEESYITTLSGNVNLSGDFDLDLRDMSGSFNVAAGGGTLAGTIYGLSFTSLDIGNMTASLTGIVDITDGLSVYIPVGTYQFSAGVTGGTFTGPVLFPASFTIDGAITLEGFQIPIHLVAEVDPATLLLPENVTLSDYADPYVIADAVKFEKFIPPDITILTTSLPDGDVGYPYSQAIEATGGIKPYSWNIISGELPYGLSLDSLTGEISGTTTTGGTFNFTVEVTDSSGPQQSASKDLSITVGVPDGIVDNVDPGFNADDTWDTFSAPDQYGTDYRYHAAGDGSSIATWEAELTNGAGRYEVAVWYPKSDSESFVFAANAPYTINHADGSDTVPVNQNKIKNGGKWVSIGIYDFADDGTEYVSLSDDADSWVAADAVRFYFRAPGAGEDPDDSIVDNADTGFSAVGTWKEDTKLSGFEPPDYRWHAAGDGSSVVTWDVELTDGTGYYEVFVKYAISDKLATNAPYTINHADGSDTVPVDQSINGGKWVSIGTYNFADDGTEYTSLSDDADSWVVADAVKFSFRGSLYDGIVDNVDINFSVDDSWLEPVVKDSAYGGTYSLHTGNLGGTGAIAMWNAELINGPGSYEVFVWYPVSTFFATNASFTINHDGVSETVELNQSVNGGQWVSIGIYNFANDGTEYVSLSDDADSWVAADAVKFVSIP